MIRVRDQFDERDGMLVWLESTMQVVPAIRLDNIESLDRAHDFPAKEYKDLFEINVSN
jgi:hypothetical protein